MCCPHTHQRGCQALLHFLLHQPSLLTGLFGWQPGGHLGGRPCTLLVRTGPAWSETGAPKNPTLARMTTSMCCSPSSRERCSGGRSGWRCVARPSPTAPTAACDLRFGTAFGSAAVPKPVSLGKSSTSSNALRRTLTYPRLSSLSFPLRRRHQSVVRTLGRALALAL